MPIQPLRFVSRLAASPAQVWASISTMPGVNFELSPLMKMTYPSAAAELTLEQAPLGVCAFHSYLLLGGLVPFDRHALTLVAITPGRGFVEESSSLLQRRWRHERHVLADASGGCTLIDELRFSPRLAWMEPLVARIVTALFSHRHLRLRQRFGGSAVEPAPPGTH